MVRSLLYNIIAGDHALGSGISEHEQGNISRCSIIMIPESSKEVCILRAGGHDLF